MLRNSSNSKSSMRAIKGIVSLYGLNAVQIFVPLLTVPFLSRALGIKSFGELAIATGFVGYFIIVTEWGFALSATQKIAESRNSQEELRTIFWDVLLAKLVLGSLSLIVAFTLALVIFPQSTMRALVAIASIQILASVCSLSWFLQGRERMVSYSLINVVSRLATIPLTIFFVKNEGDGMVAMLIVSGAALTSSLLGVLCCKNEKFLWPPNLNAKGAYDQLRGGGHIFLSQAGVAMYNQTNAVVLGILSGAYSAGMFSGADKLRRAIQAFVGPISVYLFPGISSMVKTNAGLALSLAGRALILQSLIGLTISMILFFAAEPLILTALGQDFLGAVTVLQILSPTPFFVAISNSLGTLILLPHGRQKEYTRIIIVLGLFNVILLSVLCPEYGALGAAVALMTTEVLVSLSMAAVSYKVRMNPIR
jgi:PST family polysaccharide transporter